MNYYQIRLVKALIKKTIYTGETREAQIAEAVWQDVQGRRAFIKLNPEIVKFYIKLLTTYYLLPTTKKVSRGTTKKK